MFGDGCERLMEGDLKEWGRGVGVRSGEDPENSTGERKILRERKTPRLGKQWCVNI